MAMAGMWTRERTTLLIDLYEKNDCLWKNTSPYYRNKQRRKDALENIAVGVGLQQPGITIEDIKSKINGIRTQFVAEVNRVIVSEHRREAYEPTLWCFERLAFLKPYTQPKRKPMPGNGWSNWMEYQAPPQDPRQFSFSAYTAQTDEDSVIIKDESMEDVVIVEDEDQLNIDGDENNSYFAEHEDTNKMSPSAMDSGLFTDESQGHENEKFKKNTSPTPTEIQDHDRIRRLISAPCSSSEITLIRKETKRKHNEDIKHKSEKLIRCDEDSILTPTKKQEEDRIDIFGKFIISQMRSVTDKVLLMKLEHTIQNAIINAQLKQIEIDAKKN